jgi:hypothetical protein
MNLAATDWTVQEVRRLLKGEPVFLAGSLVAAQTYRLPDAWSDVDLFCPTHTELVIVGQRLIDAGFKLPDRMERTWERWKRYGFKGWHTNSLKLMSPQHVEFNLVFKTLGGHPTNSLAQVIESFDFGLLATGWDLESDTFRDMRSYLFPGMDPDGPLPMMPNKREAWRNGFISQYNGLRECGRYAKYHAYGYDLSMVKDDLVSGYWEGSSYLSTHFDVNKQMLGRIYETIAAHIEHDNITELVEASKQINYTDSLDQIMEALE